MARPTAEQVTAILTKAITKEGTQWSDIDMNGVNEYGVPLHACNGYRLDEHYWAWLGAVRVGLATRGKTL